MAATSPAAIRFVLPGAPRRDAGDPAADLLYLPDGLRAGRPDLHQAAELPAAKPQPRSLPDNLPFAADRALYVEHVFPGDDVDADLARHELSCGVCYRTHPVPRRQPGADRAVDQ